ECSPQPDMRPRRCPRSASAAGPAATDRPSTTPADLRADVVEIMGGNVALETGLPISRDRTVDDRGIELGHRHIVEPEPLHDARPKLLDDDIRAFDQGLQPGPFSSVFEVDGDAALAAIEQREASAVVPPFGRTATHLLAARRLDLDHLRAG